jgi:hypothetical protein
MGSGYSHLFHNFLPPEIVSLKAPGLPNTGSLDSTLYIISASKKTSSTMDIP